MITDLIISILGGYLLGSIPFALILTKMSGHGDIRKIGSGNVGTTNALRAGGLKVALPVLILDVMKGAAAFWLFGPWGGLAAVIGHNFPIWLGFKGGKGVAVSGGFLLALSPPVFAICFAAWLAVEIAFRYSSVSAMVAYALAPALGFLMISNDAGWSLAGLSVLGLYMHRGNIARLLAGKENKISFKKKK